MAFIVCYTVFVILIVLGLCVCLLYLYLTRNFNYWLDRGVPCVKPHWFLGSFHDVIMKKKQWHVFLSDIYYSYKNVGYAGSFLIGEKGLFLLDRQLIEKILVQDFLHFQDRLTPYSVHDPILTSSLYHNKGQKWRSLRYKLIPTFTLGKVRNMFDQMMKCSDNVLEQIELLKADETDMEVLAFVFVTEVTTSCFFGIQLNSDSNLWNECLNALDSITNPSPLTNTRLILGIFYPNIFNFLNIKIFNKHIADFFINVTESTVKYRDQNRIKRSDFLEMILNLKKEEENRMNQVTMSECNEQKHYLKEISSNPLNLKQTREENVFNKNSIASLMQNFIGLGVKPTARIISFALFEIAKNCNIQDKIQEEVTYCISKHQGLSYEAIKDMIYIDQVIQETMRLHTTTPLLVREVTSPYRLPETEVILQKGDFVCIPGAAIHRDPQLYPDPEQFDPDRFTGNNYKSSATYLPFGHGPRICIAIRYAVLIIKVCLARILSKYTVRLGRKMVLPLRYDDSEFNLKSASGVWLLFHKKEE